MGLIAHFIDKILDWLDRIVGPAVRPSKDSDSP